MANASGKQSLRSNKPKCCIISDIHFSPATLDLATAALVQAQRTAHDLAIPLILAGDTLDTKDILRGQVVNRLIQIFADCSERPYIIPGNHCMLNEKSQDHALNFLAPYTNTVSTPTHVDGIGYLIPYQHDQEKLKSILADIPEGSTIICHQGIHGANMGHYQQDKSSLSKEYFANFRTISGHYHCAQDIKCGRPRKDAVGLFSYVGNPYTLNFGEADDPEKGYAVLMSDGLLERLPTYLRKHVILDCPVYALSKYEAIGVGMRDMIWLKVKGIRSELAKLDKKVIGETLFGHSNYKLDLIPTDAETKEMPVEKMQDSEILDSLIDTQSDTQEHKDYLKKLWRDL